jgi:anti-anti-sigma factor
LHNNASGVPGPVVARFAPAFAKAERESVVMLPFQVREVPDGLIITLDSPVTLNDFRSSTLREALYQFVLSRNEPRIVVDLSAIDYLSSSGVAILVGLKRRVDLQHGKLVLCRVQPLVYDLLRVMRLNQYFAFAKDEAEALALVRPLPTA